MYAVIESGGKQYRVAVGDRVKVERLKAAPGTEVELDRVLLIADGDDVRVGTPVLGAKVAAKVVSEGRGEKIRILKFRRRQNSRTHGGHRQNYTELEITGIDGQSAAPKKSKAKKESKPEVDVEEPVAAEPEAPVESTAGADDLTQLSGVGPKLAEKLNAAGVTTLAQVAAFTQEDIDRIDAELNFKGRIERDDWVGQAKKLTEES